MKIMQFHLITKYEAVALLDKFKKNKANFWTFFYFFIFIFLILFYF